MPLAALALGGLFLGPSSPFAVGLVLAAVIPIGVTSVIWTGMARGEVPLALTAVTIDSLLSPLLVPCSAWLFLGHIVHFDAMSLFSGLFVMIVLPTAAALTMPGSHRRAPGRLPRPGQRLVGQAAPDRGSGHQRGGRAGPDRRAMVVADPAARPPVVPGLSRLPHGLRYRQGAWLRGAPGRRDDFLRGHAQYERGIVLAMRYFSPQATVAVVLAMLFQQPLGLGLSPPFPRGRRGRPGPETRLRMRLIPLNAGHRPLLAKLLAGQAVHNILLLGRLDRLGADPRVAFWGLAGQDGLEAVLGLDGTDWALANPRGADLYPFAQVIEARGRGRLRAEAGVVAGLARHLRDRVAAEQGCLLVRLAPGGPPPAESGAEQGPAALRRLNPEEAAAPPDWLTMNQRPVRVLAAVTDGLVVAAAWTEVEVQGLALVGGVATAPEHRGHGLGSACLLALSRELQAEGLAPQLVYDCPVIGRLAGKIGYTPFGRWREITLRGED